MFNINNDGGIRICGFFYNGFNIFSYDILFKGRRFIFFFLVGERLYIFN